MERARESTTGVGDFQFRQSEALLRTVLENAAVGMAIVGTDSRLMYVNRSYADMLGRGRDECAGLGIGELIHPDEIAEARVQFGRLVRGEVDGYRVERRHVRKDGSVVWGLTSASMLRNERTGQPLYVIIQVTDIGAQKRAEMALAASERRWNHALESAGQGVWDHDLRQGTVFRFSSVRSRAATSTSRQNT